MIGFTEQELDTDPNKVGFSIQELENNTSNVENQMPEVGTYTQDDMVENDTMFNIIEDYMLDRYGIQAVEDKDKRTIVDDFLDNRRGVSGGNTIRGLTYIFG